MKAVSFDLDGVLIQNPFGTFVAPRVAAHIHATSSLSAHPFEEAAPQIQRAVREEWARRMTAQDFVAAYDWDDIYTRVSHSFQGESVPDVTQLVCEGCVAPHITLLEGAREALELLRDAGFTLYALTNGYAKYQRPVLDALGILPLFADVYSPERLGYAKPSAEMFRELPGLVAHVGDTLEHDILGANLAGVASIWLSPQLDPALTPADRDAFSREPLKAYLQRAVERALYVHFHPEATTELLTPSAAVQNAEQAARWLLSQHTAHHAHHEVATRQL